MCAIENERSLHTVIINSCLLLYWNIAYLRMHFRATVSNRICRFEGIYTGNFQIKSVKEIQEVNSYT